ATEPPPAAAPTTVTDTLGSAVVERASTASVATCPASVARTLTGSLNAITLTTSYFGNNDDAPTVAEKFGESCLDFKMKIFTGDLTLENLLAIAPYGTVAISTHGVVDDTGQVYMVTNETADHDQVDPGGEYESYWNNFQIALLDIPKDLPGGGRKVFAVAPA